MSRLRENLPLVACLLVLASFVFPGRSYREVKSLKRELSELKQRNQSLDAIIVSISDYIAGLDDRIIDVVSDRPLQAGGGAGSTGIDSPLLSVPASVHFFSSPQGRGITDGKLIWFVGSSSPWGCLSDAYVGGFVADGRRYSCLGVSRSKRGIDD